MHIQVSGGRGYGPTELAAFDHALHKAGIPNFNLIYLSSILPPGSNVKVTKRPKTPKGNWG
jgi:arginine decarboxylase